MSEEKNNMRRPVTSIAAAASTLCIGLAAGAPSASEKTPEPGIDVQVPDSKERIEQYWTRDRMLAAKPMPKPVISRETGSPVNPEKGSTESE
jgi:hypothetical protein